MSLRSIPADFDPGVVTSIDTRLDEIERAQGVRILLAIESGSRAWGFPSPDSDYDCRFVFLRPLDQHLSLWPSRDVIETPLDKVLDVNGWELAKALKLLVRGNAVIVEWLRSPIIYRGDPAFRDSFLTLAERLADRSLIANHYLHLGERQRRLHFADETAVPLKKAFYALRPATVLRWLRLHPTAAAPPMHFPTLIGETDPSPELAAIVADLLRRKAGTRELGRETLPRPVLDFIDAEFALARDTLSAQPKADLTVARREADAFLRSALTGAGEFQPSN